MPNIDFVAHDPRTLTIQDFVSCVALNGKILLNQSLMKCLRNLELSAFSR